MKITLEDLLKVERTNYRPSIEVAKKLLSDVLQLDEASSGGPKSIFDEYFDHGYTPSYAEIEVWAREQAESVKVELFGAIEEAIPRDEDDDHPSDIVLRYALDRHANSEIEDYELILEVAELWAWMDKSPFWSGSAADRHWHVAKILSAIRQLATVNLAAIDAVSGLQEESICQLISTIEEMQSSKTIVASIPDIREAKERCVGNANIVLEAFEQLKSLSIKLGFLYRDAWWIEKHGEVTIRGYLAQQTSEKAGEGGGKRSSGGRRQRIRYFLVAHAELIARNPILRQDPQKEVAFRALKLAIKKNPAAFKRGRSKQVAVEYWEYIKSDTELFEEYKNVLQTSI